jgi:hypothetical protein
MSVFSKTLSELLDAAWDDWFLKWSGSTPAFGGVAGWVPGSPPSPGPWVGGTITPAVLDGSGASSSLLMKKLPDDFVNKLRLTSVTIDIEESDAVTMKMVETEHTENFARAISGGLSDTFLNSMKQVELFDKSDVGASGIASPGGSVVGTISCSLNVQ